MSTKKLQVDQSAARECQEGMILHISKSTVASLQYKLKRDHTPYVFFVRKCVFTIMAILPRSMNVLRFFFRNVV